MIIVVDTNRIIAALIKNGVSRQILFSKNFHFITPSFTLTEISKYKKHIMKKAVINENQFWQLLDIIFERVRIIPKTDYENKIRIVTQLISDKEDISFLALAISQNCNGIWSDDAHFLEQNKVKIFTTKKMIRIL